ncbi:hypothetical protein [Roseovarius sp. A-2]|uniref:hypothetical protein n=1 Tax=Roseovarius sp. A-2 TaxID=1570360 RepID=UPI0011182F0B|nr:hypothetical protein [Roseovarius sp. A-2]
MTLRGGKRAAAAHPGRSGPVCAGLSGCGAIPRRSLCADQLVDLVFGRPLAQAEIVGIALDPTAIACLGPLPPARD